MIRPNLLRRTPHTTCDSIFEHSHTPAHMKAVRRRARRFDRDFQCRLKSLRYRFAMGFSFIVHTMEFVQAVRGTNSWQYGTMLHSSIPVLQYSGTRHCSMIIPGTSTSTRWYRYQVLVCHTSMCTGMTTGMADKYTCTRCWGCRVRFSRVGGMRRNAYDTLHLVLSGLWKTPHPNFRQSCFLFNT